MRRVFAIAIAALAGEGLAHAAAGPSIPAAMPAPAHAPAPRVPSIPTATTAPGRAAATSATAAQTAVGAGIALDAGAGAGAALNGGATAATQAPPASGTMVQATSSAEAVPGNSSISPGGQITTPGGLIVPSPTTSNGVQALTTPTAQSQTGGGGTPGMGGGLAIYYVTPTGIFYPGPADAGGDTSTFSSPGPPVGPGPQIGSGPDISAGPEVGADGGGLQ